MKDRLYAFFIGNKPFIREEYTKHRDSAYGFKKYVLFLYIILLNMVYPFLLKKRNPFYGGKTCGGKSESSASKRMSPEDTAEKLLKYDVISFDVFDTLILRNVSEPGGVFDAVGIKLLYPGFRKIRVKSEKKAREKKYNKSKCREVTLSEIWDKTGGETGIDKKTGIKAEWECEKSLCTGNPYMKSVLKILNKHKKRIIAVTDTYLPEKKVRKLLEVCGIKEIQEIYCSCEYDKSKAMGSLYAFVKEREGKNLSFAHVGDNKKSDVKNARSHGIKAVYYKNINRAGSAYRTCDMTLFVGSLYRGIINSRIHCGFDTFSWEYEYGFIYGGLFAVGYCKFIKKFVSLNNIQKILFLSRDGALLKKLYERMYPEDKKKTEYVYWSRLAALKICREYFKDEYYGRMIFHKASGKYTLREVLGTMELPLGLKETEKAVNACGESVFNRETGKKLKCFIEKNGEKVREGYREQREAGKIYYKKILENCSSAAAVDIGWAGSGAAMLDTAVNKVWNLNCDIRGIIGGAVSFNSPDRDSWECYLQTGKVISYMFSRGKNRDLWLFHNPSRGHNLYFESLFSDASGSLIGFYLDKNGQVMPRFKENSVNPEKINEVHKGILDFAEIFLSIEKSLGFEIKICGRDAYAPMFAVCRSRNKKFKKKLRELADCENL